MLKKIIILLWLTQCLFIGWGSGNPEEPPRDYSDRVSTEELGGEERYLTHLSTDKQIYKPGEPVYIRGVLLHGKTGKSFGGYAAAIVSITGPRGELVIDSTVELSESVLGYSWNIPIGLGGGEYTARITYPDYSGGFAPAERKFQVRAYRAPRLKTQITFLKDGYNPGETVKAVCEIERAEGGIPAGASVTVTARVDNQEVHNSIIPVDQDGNCEASFDLPLNITEGEGTLLFTIKDGGVTETAAKTIPILLDNFDIAFYPEGGDLVGGLENRVYFEARFANGKPAQISGVIKGPGNVEAASVTAEHEGRGVFSFTPKGEESYFLELIVNGGEEKRFPLPRVKSGGVVLKAGAQIFRKKEPLSFKVASTDNREVTLIITRQETVIMRETTRLTAKKWSDITLAPPAAVVGILTATVWSGDIPLAERLVYREPGDNIKVEFSLDKENPSPGDSVTLSVKTSNSRGEPISASVGITVTDEAVLKLMEEREEAPFLPAMVFLENNVMELADANVYLDPGNADAPGQLDLLLGTQGWRRFAFVQWNTFLADYGDKAKRVAAFRLPQVPMVFQEEERFMINEMPMEPMAKGIPEAAVMAMPVDDGMVADMAVIPPPMPDAAEEPGGVGEGVAAVKEDMPAAEIDLGDIQFEEMDEVQFRLKKDKIMPVYIRVYAHKKRENWSASKRIDFTETLYWCAALKTDTAGKAEVSFDLNDSITSFRVLADGFSSDGLIGAETMSFNSVKPLYIEPKMPLEITQGDHITLPIALVNNLSRDLEGKLEIKLSGALIKTIPVRLGSESRRRQLVEIPYSGNPGEQEISVVADFGEYRDSVTRTFKAGSPGFPIEYATGGFVSPDEPVNFQVDIPAVLIKGSLETEMKVYPSPVGNLTQAMEALIRQPYGCFEQTSSTSYPLVMAQRYFMSHSGVDPQLIRKAQTNLDEAYKRLTGFESPEKGYEWFGGNPGHEALTAYGLMQFLEMKEVMDVDPGMIQRTMNWLLDRRDGAGGFKRNSRALDSFGAAPEDTTNAYITWALTSAGQSGLEKELAALKDRGFHTEDSYLMALAADTLFKSGDRESSIKLLKLLAKKQNKEGAVEGAVTSITRSGGNSLIVETTALALLGWMKDDSFAANVERGMKYIVEQCQNGMFYSTQGTILALKAIIFYDELRSKSKAPGTLKIFVDGKPLGGEYPFTKEQTEPLELGDISYLLTPGRHTVSVRMEGGGRMPFTSQIRYNSPLPASSPQCTLELETVLADSIVNESGGTEVRIKVTNKTSNGLPTPIALVGLPGGLEPRHDQLRELVKAGVVDAYEIKGQQIVFYWRALKANEVKNFSVSCIASLPGKYKGPASRVYEYYTAEYKQWVEGLQITITPNQ